MIKTGHNGWFQINLAPGANTNISEPFNVTFNLHNPVQRMSFNDAANYTAQLIASKYKNIHLALSGGMDSEFVAEVLLRNHIPFVPVIILTDTNAGEVWWAEKFCASHGLNAKVLDYRDSKTNPLLEWLLALAVKLHVQPTLGLLPILVAKDLGDVNLLTGYGEPFRISSSFNDPMGTKLEIADHDFVFELSNIQQQHPGAFFTYTPELFRALVGSVDYAQHSQFAKAELYNILVRPKIHYNIFDLAQSPVLLAIRKKLAKESNLKYQCLEKDKLLEQL